MLYLTMKVKYKQRKENRLQNTWAGIEFLSLLQSYIWFCRFKLSVEELTENPTVFYLALLFYFALLIILISKI